MKKALLYFFFLTTGSLIILITILSTRGIETKRFNSIISNQIQGSDSNVEANFNKILFKFDIKKFDLFLLTRSPNIKLYKTYVPIKEVRAYIDFEIFSKNKITIDKIYLDIGEISLKKIKKILLKTKPSNFKSIIFNNLTNGSLSSKIDLQFDEDFMLIDYQLSGYVKNLSGFFQKMDFKKANFIPWKWQDQFS